MATNCLLDSYTVRSREFSAYSWRLSSVFQLRMTTISVLDSSWVAMSCDDPPTFIDSTQLAPRDSSPSMVAVLMVVISVSSPSRLTETAVLPALTDDISGPVSIAAHLKKAPSFISSSDLYVTKIPPSDTLLCHSICPFRALQTSFLVLIPSLAPTRVGVSSLPAHDGTAAPVSEGSDGRLELFREGGASLSFESSRSTSDTLPIT